MIVMLTPAQSIIWLSLVVIQEIRTLPALLRAGHRPELCMRGTQPATSASSGSPLDGEFAGLAGDPETGARARWNF